MKKILAIAPHPDDETLGCGATLLRHRAEGCELHWLIATEMTADAGFAHERIQQRNQEIAEVAEDYGFASVHRLGFATMQLDAVPMSDMVRAIAQVVQKVAPHTLYLPYRNDAHSDHAVVFDAAVACGKSFRYPSVRSMRAYETLSETEFGLKPEDPGFRPNLFVDISAHLPAKLRILQRYHGEMAPFPFPRSEQCVMAQAALRGSQAGLHAAEAFMTLKEII